MIQKIVAESLYEYRDTNKSNNDELNEGLFGLNDQQKAKIKEAAGKAKLEDADVDALSTEKLIKPVLDAFKVGIPGTQAADLALKAKNMMFAEPKKYKDTLLKFVKVFVQGLTDTAKAKIYSYDPNTKMLMPRLGDMQKPSLAGGQLSN